MPWVMVTDGFNSSNITGTSTTNTPIPGSPVQSYSTTLTGTVLQARPSDISDLNPFLVVARTRLNRPQGTRTVTGTAPIHPGAPQTLSPLGFFSLNNSVGGPNGEFGEGFASFNHMANPKAVTGLPNVFMRIGLVGNGISTGVDNLTGGMQVEGASRIINPIPAGAHALVVARNSPSAQASEATMMVTNTNSPGTSGFFIAFNNGAGAGGSGSYIGTISTPGSTTAYNTSSDYRLKQEITPLNNIAQLEKINALRPRTWKWKDSLAPGIGFIAHEVQEIFEDDDVGVTGVKDEILNKGYVRYIESGEYVETYTKLNEETQTTETLPIIINEPTEERKAELASEGKEWVKTEEEPIYQGIDASFLISPLVASVQALTTKVQQLEARVAALESV